MLTLSNVYYLTAALNIYMHDVYTDTHIYIYTCLNKLSMLFHLIEICVDDLCTLAGLIGSWL